MNIIQKNLISLINSFRKRKFRNDLLNAIPFWTGAFLTGIVSVLFSKLFLWAESGTYYIFSHASWLFFIITPLCFVLSYLIVLKFAPFARGSGIPQVSAAIELTNPKHYYRVRKLLSVKVIFIKIVSTLVMVFGGGVVGREGPTIQIAASIFKKINDVLPDWYPKISRRNMIVTGAAAGLASAFNTPLGGIVFAIEELTKTHFNFFKTALLTGVLIAGLTALNLIGPYLYLGYPVLTYISKWILLIVIPIALITGVGGSLMGNIILYIFKKKSAIRSTHKLLLYSFICGLILAALAYFTDNRVFGSGKEIMLTSLFSKDKYLEWYVPILRYIGPIISFSTGASGGIFAPALSAGASIGALVSGWFHLSDTDSNLIVLCGMVGFLTGVTRSPFTSAVLVIEMTNDHDIIFYLMLTALTASLISNLVSRHSFYDHLKDQFIREIHNEESQVNILPGKTNKTVDN